MANNNKLTIFQRLNKVLGNEIEGPKYIIDQNSFKNLSDSDLEQKKLDLNFWFHDNFFSKLNWSFNPNVDIGLLYKLRAKQLREKYDYLILSYSGGADSDQILKTFIQNDILIDEVICNFPFKLLEKTTPIPDPLHPLGLIFEYQFAAVPSLKLLAEKSPKTKITLNDFTDFLQTNYLKDNTIVDNEAYLAMTPGFYQDTKRIFQNRVFNDIAETSKKKNVAVIFGADKPILKIVNNQSLFFYFSDTRTMASIIQKTNSKSYVPELFYWSKDAPLIPIQQSHIILNFIKKNKKLKKFLLAQSEIENKKYMIKFKETSLVKNLIYPAWENQYQKEVKGADDGIFEYYYNYNISDLLKNKNKL